MTPALGGLAPGLLAHTMVRSRKMLGRLAASHPETFPRDRPEKFASALMALLPSRRRP
ncbi:MAG TPA: hypothetical protein VH496_13510 [Mycobacterium sp.]|jgi:hypothetical protein